jgi:Protein of unknown function (DUF2917)
LEIAMTASLIAQLPQSAPAKFLPGTWKLARGRVITLRPATDGILRVAQGRVWATVDGPHGATPSDSGDHVLEVGRSMWVGAGQRVVIEAWNRVGAAFFSWDPVVPPVMVPAERRRLNLVGVLQPLADLRLALGLAAGALSRLAVGLGRLAMGAAHNGRHGNALRAR